MEIIQLGKTETLEISRRESDFDRACDAAYSAALLRFGIDEDGYSSKLQEWERSVSSIEMDFVSYKLLGAMGGKIHLYVFSAKAIQCIDED